MSVEYILFDAATRDRFDAFVSAKGVTSEMRQDPMEGFVVAVPADLAETLLDSINLEYESLLGEQMAATQSKEGWLTHRVTGVNVTFADGRSCVVRLPGAIAHQLSLRCTPDEIHALVSAIAESVDTPSTARSAARSDAFAPPSACSRACARDFPPASVR